MASIVSSTPFQLSKGKSAFDQALENNQPLLELKNSMHKPWESKILSQRKIIRVLLFACVIPVLFAKIHDYRVRNSDLQSTHVEKIEVTKKALLSSLAKDWAKNEHTYTLSGDSLPMDFRSNALQTKKKDIIESSPAQLYQYTTQFGWNPLKISPKHLEKAKTIFLNNDKEELAKAHPDVKETYHYFKNILQDKLETETLPHIYDQVFIACDYDSIKTLEFFNLLTPEGTRHHLEDITAKWTNRKDALARHTSNSIEIVLNRRTPIQIVINKKVHFSKRDSHKDLETMDCKLDILFRRKVSTLLLKLK